MKILVLISTIDDGLRHVPDNLLPSETNVWYVVCWQQTKSSPSTAATEAAARLTTRADVRLTTLAGYGLCRNRNHAIATAISYLDHPMEDAIFVIADDDERLLPDAFDHLRAAYQRFPRMDGALWRLRSTADGQYLKQYPDDLVTYGRHPRSYYPSSVEMTFRTRVWQMGFRFDERFGLGSDYLCAGEEDVLLIDLLRKGLHVLIIPEMIGQTDQSTTGTHTLEPKVLRSKGAVYGYQRSFMGAVLRSLREALSIARHYKVNPLPLFRELWRGLKYIRS